MKTVAKAKAAKSANALMKLTPLVNA